MKRVLYYLACLVLTCSVGIALKPAHSSASPFNSSDLMDDFTFSDSSTMSASQINTWLDTYYPSGCVSPDVGFSAPDPTGFSPSLNNFTFGGNVTAGQVFYDAAAAYGLNPQVLIAMAQEQKSLISGTGSEGCSTLAIAGTEGYDCPDGGTLYNYTGVDLYTLNGDNVTSVNGTCVNSNKVVGFSQQVIVAAWKLKYNEERSEGNVGWDVSATNFPESGDSWNDSDDPQSCYYGPMTEGNYDTCPNQASPVYYDGYTTIDGSSTFMSTGATASLYYYTPHFSGNEGFDTIFNQYFGSQFATDTDVQHPNGTLVSDGPHVYLVTNNTLELITTADIFFSYGYQWSDVIPASTGDGLLPQGPQINTFAPGTLITTGNGAPVYVMDYFDSTLKPQWLSYSSFVALGYNWSQVMTIPQAEMPTTIEPGVYTSDQHPSGSLILPSGQNNIYMVNRGNLQYIENAIAFESNYYNWSNVLPATSADMTLPISSPINLKQGTMILNDNNIYVINYSGDEIQKDPVGPWECYANRWHYTSSDWFVVPDNLTPNATGPIATC